MKKLERSIRHAAGEHQKGNQDVPSPATIRAATGLNKKEFTARYKIPYRTWQNWELGIAPCPEYILLLLDRAVQADFGE